MANQANIHFDKTIIQNDKCELHKYLARQG